MANGGGISRPAGTGESDSGAEFDGAGHLYWIFETGMGGAAGGGMLLYCSGGDSGCFDCGVLCEVWGVAAGRGNFVRDQTSGDCDHRAGFVESRAESGEDLAGGGDRDGRGGFECGGCFSTVGAGDCGDGFGCGVLDFNEESTCGFGVGDRMADATSVARGNCGCVDGGCDSGQHASVVLVFSEDWCSGVWERLCAAGVFARGIY